GPLGGVRNRSQVERQSDRHENGEDQDDHQQLDQGEATSSLLVKLAIHLSVSFLFPAFVPGTCAVGLIDELPRSRACATPPNGWCFGAGVWLHAGQIKLPISRTQPAPAIMALG